MFYYEPELEPPSDEPLVLGPLSRVISVRNQATSNFSVKANGLEAGRFRLQIAEGVEEVTRIRILETMVQCRGQR